MKSLPVSLSLSLVLAAALAAHAQDTPVSPAPPVPPLPPLEPAKPADAPGAGLPGGKIVLKSGSGDTATMKVLDFHAEHNADSPTSLKFNRINTLKRSAGPVTFMGVAVSSAPQELANHLPLDPGTGLVVETVTKDSPAEKSGIQPNDILTKLDDQLLIHPTQFSVLVARKKEGDSVKLSLLRKGVVQEFSVTLGKSDSGDVAGSSGTLEIGDVKIQIDGADTSPLRTIVKQLRMDGADGSAVVEINGDRIRTIQDAQHEKLKDLSLKTQDLGKAVRDEALQAMEKAQAAAEAAGSEFKAKAKLESIRQLEEALRRLKEQ